MSRYIYIYIIYIYIYIYICVYIYINNHIHKLKFGKFTMFIIILKYNDKYISSAVC